MQPLSPREVISVVANTLVGGLEGDAEIVEFGPAGARSRQVLVGLGSRNLREASEGPLGEDLALEGRNLAL